MLFSKHSKNSLFSKDIDPSCAICENGHAAQHEENVVYCVKNGPVNCHYHCERFVYAPLKRIPRRKPSLPQYDEEDFKL